MFKQLVKRPVYISKFALYILFISFSVIIYFSKTLLVADKDLKLIFMLTFLLYGAYRLIRTYQEFKAEIKDEDQYQ